MNRAMIESILRHLLGGAGAVLATKGYIEASAVEPLVGAVLTLAMLVWGAVEKRRLTPR
jgi:hypothetical protein